MHCTPQSAPEDELPEMGFKIHVTPSVILRSIPTLNAQFMDPWRDPPLLQVSTFALGSRKSWLTTAFTSESKSPPPLQGETRVFFKAEVERVSARSQRKCRGTVEKAVRKGVQRVRWKSEE